MNKNYKDFTLSLFDDDDIPDMDALDIFSGADDGAGDDDDASDDDDSLFDKDNDNADADDVDPDKIFDSSNPQGNVGDGDDNDKNDQGAPKSKDKGSSPTKSQFYSSALKALKDEGVLPDLDDEFIKDATDPDKFAEAIEKQVEARLDAATKRVKEALDSNVSTDAIKRYENAIAYLNDINDEALEAEDEAAIEVRKQVIYQDYINKGFKPERAEKEVAKSFNAGTDIEDAKLALESNKEFFTEEYNKVVEDNKNRAIQEKALREQKVKEFQKKILDTKDPFGIKLDNNTIQKIYENSVKPKHKVDGKVLTEVQKYSHDNPSDSEYYFGLFYTMTDGFKNIDKFVGQKVKQNTRSALREFEHKLQNLPLNSDGSVDFGDDSKDPESFFGKDFKIDI